jgi:hypothetical protein
LGQRILHWSNEMAKIYVLTATPEALTKALDLLRLSVLAYHQAEYWIDVNPLEAKEAIALLKRHGINAEMRD